MRIISGKGVCVKSGECRVPPLIYRRTSDGRNLKGVVMVSLVGFLIIIVVRCSPVVRERDLIREEIQPKGAGRDF